LLIQNEHLAGADFSNRKLDIFDVIGSQFSACRFEDTRCKSVCLGAGGGMSYYEGCVFDRSRLRFTFAGFARFVSCSFRQIEFSNWLCTGCEFVDCVFSGKLDGARFFGTVPERDRRLVGRDQNEFDGNDFSEASFRDVSFTGGIDLARQQLPIGRGYLYIPHAAEAVSRVWLDVIRWKDLTVRRNAIAMISTLEVDVRAGQEQMLIQRDTFARGRDEAVDRVFEMLASSERASIT
jgi:hypothetical protein